MNDSEQLIIEFGADSFNNLTTPALITKAENFMPGVSKYERLTDIRRPHGNDKSYVTMQTQLVVIISLIFLTFTGLIMIGLVILCKRKNTVFIQRSLSQLSNFSSNLHRSFSSYFSLKSLQSSFSLQSIQSVTSANRYSSLKNHDVDDTTLQCGNRKQVQVIIEYNPHYRKARCGYPTHQHPEHEKLETTENGQPKTELNDSALPATNSSTASQLANEPTQNGTEQPQRANENQVCERTKCKVRINDQSEMFFYEKEHDNPTTPQPTIISPTIFQNTRFLSNSYVFDDVPTRDMSDTE